jgi:hypothetical protein
VGGRVHEVSRFRRDGRVPLPAPLPPWVDQIPVDVAETPRVALPDRPLDANPPEDGKVHLPGAEVRQDVK